MAPGCHTDPQQKLSIFKPKTNGDFTLNYFNSISDFFFFSFYQRLAGYIIQTITIILAHDQQLRTPEPPSLSEVVFTCEHSEDLGVFLHLIYLFNFDVSEAGSDLVMELN